MGVDADAGFIRDVIVKSLCLGLLHQCIPVGDEQNPPRLIGAQEDIYQRHRHTGLAGAGGHHQQRFALGLLECLTHPPDALLLVHPVGDGRIDRGLGQGCLVLPAVEQIVQIAGGEEAVHQPLVGPAHVPEVDVVPVGHKGKGPETLQLLDFGDVNFSLGFGQPGINAGAFGFYDGDGLAVGAVEHVVTDPFGEFDIVWDTFFAQAVQPGFKRFPCLGIEPVHGDLNADLVGIIDVPACFFQGGVYEFFSGLCFGRVGQFLRSCETLSQQFFSILSPSVLCKREQREVRASSLLTAAGCHSAHNRVEYAYQGGGWRLTTAEKKRILRKTISGLSVFSASVVQAGGSTGTTDRRH